MRSKDERFPYSFSMEPGKEHLLKFDLQRHGDGDAGGDDGAGGDGTSGDGGGKTSEKLVDFTDPITNRKIQIPEGFRPIIGHIISATRKETEGKYAGLEDTIKNLQSENEEFTKIKDEFEKLQQEKLTVEERAQMNAEKVIKEHEKRTKEATDKASFWEQRFKETMVRNEIMEAFGNHKLCNPEQVAVLFEKEGSARVEEKVDYNGKPTGQYETRVTLNIEDEKGMLNMEEGTPKELFSKWIKMENNSHHLQNDLTPGGGTSQKIKLHSGEKINLSEVKNPIERMNLAREYGNK